MKLNARKKIHTRGRHYFIVSKPLQFFVVRSILKQIPADADTVMSLVGTFNKLRDFFDLIRNSFPEFRVIFIKIDSPKIYISVYEDERIFIENI